MESLMISSDSNILTTHATLMGSTDLRDCISWRPVLLKLILSNIINALE